MTNITHINQNFLRFSIILKSVKGSWNQKFKSPLFKEIRDQSILKEISPGCSLEGMMLKLKLQYFGHLIRRVNSLEKTLMLGGIGGRRRRGRQRMRWLDGITDLTDVWVNSGSWWWTGRPDVMQFMGLQRVGHNWATELNWTELVGPDAMILVFWMLGFKPTFSLSSFTFIKRLFSSSSLCAIRVVSSAYLRLLIFLLAILIPACASSSPAFLIMCSTYKLNKQGGNIQHWHTLYPIWNQSVIPCPVLTVASWSASRFLKRQVRWSGISISLRIFQILLWSTRSKALT